MHNWVPITNLLGPCKLMKFSFIVSEFKMVVAAREAESVAAPLRAEQGPCEPSEDVVRKFGEQ